jgi:hypothetical protein
MRPWYIDAFLRMTAEQIIKEARQRQIFNSLGIRRYQAMNIKSDITTAQKIVALRWVHNLTIATEIEWT